MSGAAAFRQSGSYWPGRTDEAVEQLRDSLARQRAIQAGLLRPTFLAHLAEALLAADRIDEGLTAVQEGLEWAEQSLERYYVAELHRLRGELLRARGAGADAEGSFRSALAFAREQGAIGFELRAATGLARLLQIRGEHAAAYGLLSGVYHRFTEGFSTGDLRDAAILIEELTALGGAAV